MDQSLGEANSSYSGKEIPAFHETRLFITVLTSARRLPLPYLGYNQSSSFKIQYCPSIYCQVFQTVLSLRFPHQITVRASFLLQSNPP